MSSDLDKALSAKSDHVTADDLLGTSITAKITGVKINLKSDRKITVSYEGDDGKPFKPCVTMGRLMRALWGVDSKWAGNSFTLYRDPSAPWGGAEVGGVRISHATGIDKPTKYVMAESKHKKKAITVLPLFLDSNVTDEPEIDITPQLQLARDAAKKGTVAFKLWWKDTPECRDAAKTIMDELKKTASDFDAANDEQPM